MVVVDLGEFALDSFDPKRWINAALESRHPQDPIDRYISDLEENLRSSAENIADALERESGDAIRRIPGAIRDVLRLRDEALTLRDVVSNILLQLQKVCGLRDISSSSQIWILIFELYSVVGTRNNASLFTIFVFVSVLFICFLL